MPPDDITFTNANDNCPKDIECALSHAISLWVSLVDAMDMLSDEQHEDFEKFTEEYMSDENIK